MFAVPGWKISASSLKTQTEDKTKNNSKKRKRREQQNEDIEKVIADKDPRPTKVDSTLTSSNAGSSTTKGERVSERPSDPPAKKSKKTKRDTSTEKSRDTENGTKPAPPSLPLGAPLPTTPSGMKLTPLQTAMRSKLISSRFRFLNEFLYTSPSGNAVSKFDDNPTFFEEYHAGFRQQVETWPENPVDSFTKEFKARGKIRSGLDALPRTGGKCTIADLGCGDAMLSFNLEKQKRKLNLDILSYDLQAPNERITKADISNLPVQGGAVNVAVFCLALMGTNWIDFIEEAYRILHWKGELWIAEIKSRFNRSKQKQRVVEHSIGHKKRNQKPKSMKDQGQDQASVAEAQQQAQHEIDGTETTDETDVSGFIEVLRRRGFALKDENSVDKSNKMFVRMKFIKALSPTKGKNVKQQEAGGHMKKPKLAFLDLPEGFDESSVLQPCLYKIR